MVARLLSKGQLSRFSSYKLFSRGNQVLATAISYALCPNRPEYRHHVLPSGMQDRAQVVQISVATPVVIVIDVPCSSQEVASYVCAMFYGLSSSSATPGIQDPPAQQHEQKQLAMGRISH
jgi:ABC-type antimicrobial peptide transport system ATPase subunit